MFDCSSLDDEKLLFQGPYFLLVLALLGPWPGGISGCTEVVFLVLLCTCI
jgi:hypothetical protein